MLAVDVREETHVAEARRVAVGMARAQGFDEGDAGRVAIVATELATNLIRHGGGGTMLAGSYEDETGAGVECVALDRGRGMADVDLSMRDGHSTAGGAGNGLGAVFRGSHACDIYSAPGLGTAILTRMQPGPPPPGPRARHPGHGGVTLAMAGEDACGDAWCHRRDGNGDGFMLLVADGLGHGASAAVAAHAAVRSFTAARAGDAPSTMLAAMHAALRPTRGAAVAVARVDPAAGRIDFCGVGNIAATLVDGDGTLRRMVSSNGTVGHVAKRIRDFTYALGQARLLVLASDGLGTGWRIEDYPGLIHRHPTLIAAVLFRDFTRGRDDVTVLVACADAWHEASSWA